MNAGGSILQVARRARRQPFLGVAERFRPGEHDRVETVVAGLRRLGIGTLRTKLCWAEYHQPGGKEWYDWLLTRLAHDVDVLPCFTHPALSCGAPSRAFSRAQELKNYVDFLDRMVIRHGAHFEWLELWTEPDGRNDWNWHLDPDSAAVCDAVATAARRVKQRGKKTILSGLCPTGVNWLRLTCERSVIDHCDAIGIHRLSGNEETQAGAPWQGWQETIGAIRGILDRFDLDPEIWITEAGHAMSTANGAANGMGQVDSLLAALDAPVRRVYWCRYQDADQRAPNGAGRSEVDERCHLGLVTASGDPKLLSRLLMQGGIDNARALRRRVTIPKELRTSRLARVGFGRKQAVITGGAGFIGINLADRLAQSGQQVLIFDNLSRAGVEENLTWLMEKHRGRVSAEIADVRDADAARDAVKQADWLFHFAAQVAVTTSLCAPVEDFEINARGTLNLLEGLRAADQPPGLVYTSTNKVYGALSDIPLECQAHRHVPIDPNVAKRGVAETRALDFHSPYGCSKGAADQYVLDYARTYGLPAVVFRMSCIYGPHQRGTEDQGWVAHFLIKALQGGDITIYGDGKQVRDILYVEDLVDAMVLAQHHMPKIRGQAFNIGGGSKNTTSLIELLDLIRRLGPLQPNVTHGPARPGDQLYYVSDIGKFHSATGWAPTVNVEAGVAKLMTWLSETRDDRTVVPLYERSAS
ncbi:NAD-dependent epimerase/dehydratase family protein [Rhodospirillaceae bacterium SYSU D60014]|uniref:NAD-dependent epimerase/dehydratase family protein n=1 Tax=Virgifigura deserti TaxID=2268457 RepID=UPI000E66301A